MATDRAEKCIAMYSESGVDLWEEAEEVAREEFDADSAREGQILAEILARYLGTVGPIQKGPRP